MGIRLGVDVGGTKIEIVALDTLGATLVRRRVPTPLNDYNGILDAIASLVGGVERELGAGLPLGIGAPGAVSRTTRRIKNANSTILIGTPFADDLEAKLERTIRIDNDANCFVRSEAADGAGKDARVVFGVILGTGVGGGIAIDRRVVGGANAIAGEWGHNPLPWPREDELPGMSCYCGKFGCMETFLCGSALAREPVRARYEDRLARGLASVVNILDPDAVILGGGVSNIPDLAPRVAALLPRYVFSDSVQTKVLRAIHGDSSGVRGAAMLWAATGP